MWSGSQEQRPRDREEHSERSREKLRATDTTWRQGDRFWTGTRSRGESPVEEVERRREFQRGREKGTHQNELALDLTFFVLSIDLMLITSPERVALGLPEIEYEDTEVLGKGG